MKLKMDTVISLVVGLVIGSLILMIVWPSLMVEPDKLPAGYRVLCSIEDKYTIVFPKGRMSANVWDTEQGAIDFAVYWESIDEHAYVPESSKYTWTKKCGEELK